MAAANNTLNIFATLQYFGQTTPLFPQINFVGDSPISWANMTNFVWRQLNSVSSATVSVNLLEGPPVIKVMGFFNQDPAYTQTIQFTYIAPFNATAPYGASFTVSPNGFYISTAQLNPTFPLLVTSQNPNYGLSYMFLAG